MLQDRYGNTLTTQSSTARDAYVDGIDRFLFDAFFGDHRIVGHLRLSIPAPGAEFLVFAEPGFGERRNLLLSRIGTQ